MATYSQDDRWLRILAPKDLGLLAVSLTGREAISDLFTFELDALLPRGQELDFSKMINRTLSLRIAYPISPHRFVNGIVNELTQIERDDSFTRYRISIVPAAWRLTQSAHNRIFQQKSVLDILRTLFDGLSTTFNVASPMRPHNYCVQYRETDFDFAARLMREHGLFYYFVHEEEGHRLVIADTSRNNPLLPTEHKIEFDQMSGGTRARGRVQSWRKTQRIGSAKVSSRDYHFALPNQSLEANQSIAATVQVGKVTHRLASGNDQWTIHDPRGEYAHMFDGISPTGDDQDANLKQVFEQKDQSTKIHLESIAADSIVINGDGDAAQMVPGFIFQLDGHFDGDGKYLLTEVEHELSSGDYRAGQSGAADRYVNRFRAIPLDIPYRPKLVGEKPRIPGAILATVVGPPGEEIFTDKFGRIKIQFPWDLEGKQDGQSSCWVRPFSPMAGNGYGMIQLPRVGHEVLVGFIEGDPDEPVILGSSYNPSQMPPFKLPDNRTRMAMKSQTKNGDSSQFSGMAIEDSSGQEQLHLHSEKDMRINAENNHLTTTKAGKYERVGKFSHRMVGGIPGMGGGQDINPNNEQQNGGENSGGESSGGESENEYVGPFQWKNGDIESVLGADVSLVFGVVAEGAVGLDAAVTVGPKMEIIVNPLGLPFGGGMIAGMLGNYEINLCAETRAIYGPQYEVHHGGTTEVTGYADATTENVIKGMAVLLGLSTTAAVVVAGALAERDPTTLDIVEGVCGAVGAISLAVLTKMEHACAEGQEAIEEGEFAARLDKAIPHSTALPGVVGKLTKASVDAATKAAAEAKKAATDAETALTGAAAALAGAKSSATSAESSASSAQSSASSAQSSASSAESSASGAESSASSAESSASSAKSAESNVNSTLNTLASSRNVLIGGAYTVRAQDELRISAAKLDPENVMLNSNLFLEAIGTPEGEDGLVSINGSGAIMMQSPVGTPAVLGLGGPTGDIVGSVPPDGMIRFQMMSEFPAITINEDGIFLMANPDCGIMITEEGISMIAPVVAVEAEESLTLTSDETVLELTPEGAVCESLTMDQTFEVSMEVEVLTMDSDCTEVTYVYAMLTVT